MELNDRQKALIRAGLYMLESAAIAEELTGDQLAELGYQQPEGPEVRTLMDQIKAVVTIEDNEDYQCCY